RASASNCTMCATPRRTAPRQVLSTPGVLTGNSALESVIHHALPPFRLFPPWPVAGRWSVYDVDGSREFPNGGPAVGSSRPRGHAAHQTPGAHRDCPSAPLRSSRAHAPRDVFVGDD